MKQKLAAFLGFLPIIPTVLEGSAVLLGNREEGMIVLTWLVVYNICMAIFSLSAVVLIWIHSERSLQFSGMLFFGHFIVLCTLLGIYFTSSEVAIKSILAMSFRSVLWGLVLSLIVRMEKVDSSRR